MPYKAVVHISHVCLDQPALLLADRLTAMAGLNVLHGVTALVLFDGQRFLHYMEGIPAAVDASCALARDNSDHSSFVILTQGRIGARRFPHWPLFYVPVEPEQVLELVRADWTGFFVRKGDSFCAPSAMDILRELLSPYLPSH